MLARAAHESTLTKLQEIIDEFDGQVLKRAESVADRAEVRITAAEAAFGAFEGVLDVAGEVPIVGGAFRGAGKVLRAVRDAKDRADDVLEEPTSDWMTRALNVAVVHCD